MGLFKRKNGNNNSAESQGLLAMTALNAIADGVVITDRSGVIKFINPAAVVMTNCGSAANIWGLDYGLLFKLESKEGGEIAEMENLFVNAMKIGQQLIAYKGVLVQQQSDKRIPIAISVIPTESQDRIITFRDITKELEEEGAQTEFISTASHEMRTPVASIEGYLSLALNPQTATIDERARGYLTAAHDASTHLGHLFRDLLDVTKLDDNRLKPRPVPVEMISTVKQLADSYLTQIQNAKLKYQFGGTGEGVLGARRVQQMVYGFVDLSFLQEILGNLIENAIKYTPEGGSVYVNVLGDGDRALINVTDTGIGISADDLQHIFQKFYRSDNSQTRTVGGTGLGLYLVKQRVEAMGGRVWAESGFGEGSTFYVSLPRITGEEYEKRLIAYQQAQMQQAQQLAQMQQQVQQQIQQNQINNPSGGTK